MQNLRPALYCCMGKFDFFCFMLHTKFINFGRPNMLIHYYSKGEEFK